MCERLSDKLERPVDVPCFPFGKLLKLLRGQLAGNLMECGLHLSRNPGLLDRPVRGGRSSCYAVYKHTWWAQLFERRYPAGSV